MPLGFGYVQREADSYINWADVGRTLSGTIDEIQRVRDEKKALLEESYRKDLDFINESPVGEEKSLNEWSLNYGNNAAEMLKIQYNLLKQGKSSVKNYTSFRQNITDDTDNLYNVLGNLQTIYKEKSDRYKKGESQDLEAMEMAFLEQYGDLAVTQPFINDITGSVVIGLTEPVTESDGKTVRKLVKNPNKYISVTGLKAAANAKYDNYNPMNDIKTWVDSQGQKIQAFRDIGTEFQAGSVNEILDITGEKQKEISDKYGNVVEEFKKAENDYLLSLMSNDYNALAVFTNQMKFGSNGKQFKSTYDENDLKKDDYNYILLKRNNQGLPVPQFTQQLKDEAVSWMRRQARVMYDQKSQIDTYTEVGRQPTQVQYAPAYVYESGKETKSMGEWAKTVGLIYYGNQDERESSVRAIRSYPGVDDAYIKDNNLIVIREGKVTSQPILKDGKGVGARTMGSGILTAVFGNKYDPDAFKQLIPDNPLQAIPEDNAPVKQDPIEDIINVKVMPIITSDTFKANASDVVSKFSEELGKIGLTLNTKRSGAYNSFDVSYTDPSTGKEITKNFKSGYRGYLYENEAEASNQATALKTFINNYISSLKTNEKGMMKIRDIRSKYAPIQK